MWQVLLGIYIIVILISVAILWSSLVLAKKSDGNSRGRIHPRIELTVNDEGSTFDRRAIPFPSLSELIEK